MRNTLDDDTYLYWNYDPFFLGIACKLRKMREQTIDPKSTPGGSATVYKYLVDAIVALRNSLANENHVSDINLISIMLLALCEVSCSLRMANGPLDVTLMSSQRGFISRCPC